MGMGGQLVNLDGWRRPFEPRRNPYKWPGREISHLLHSWDRSGAELERPIRPAPSIMRGGCVLLYYNINV